MTSKKGIELIRSILTFMKNTKSFDRVLDKVVLLDGGCGHCLCEMKVEEEHENRGHTLHGGLTATLVDSISTIALMSYGEGTSPGVSVNLNISYIKAAKSASTILIDAQTLKVGKNLAFLSVDIRDKDTNLILAQVSSKGTLFVCFHIKSIVQNNACE